MVERLTVRRLFLESFEHGLWDKPVRQPALSAQAFHRLLDREGLEGKLLGDSEHIPRLAFCEVARRREGP